MPLEWKYVSPTGDPQTGDGTLGNPYAASILWMNDGADNPIGAGTAVGFLPGTYQQPAPMRFRLAEGQSDPPDPITSSAEPLILAGVDESGELLAPVRTAFGKTGSLRPQSLRRINVDPDKQFMTIVPPTTTFFGLHIVGSVNGPLLRLPDPASAQSQLAWFFDSCLIENQCDRSNASGVNAATNCSLFNCDVSVPGSASSCSATAVGAPTVKGRIAIWSDGARLGVVSCRTSGGAVGVRVNKNSRVYGSLLAGHSDAGVWVDLQGGGMLLANTTIDQATSSVLVEQLTAQNAETWSVIANGQATSGDRLFESLVTDNAWLLLNTRAGGMSQSPPYSGLNALAEKLATLDTSSPADDYVDAAAGDYRLKPAAPGTHDSLLSRNDLGAFKNEGDG